MVRSRLWRPVMAAGLVVFAAACSDTPNPVEPGAELSAARGQAGAGGDLVSDSELERQVPGFGGFFLAADGTPTVYLTRGSARANAERALGGYLAARGLGVAALRIQEARYEWQQLERWKGAATMAAFESQGTVFVDNDETVNKVRIGVADLSSMGQVRAAVARSGLPDDAVIIERAEPVVRVASLQNVTDRPVRAGVQINFPGYVCSVGFVAVSGTQNSMITASHCTNVQGGVESTPYWQPAGSTAAAQIAVEVADPQYNRNGAGCPKGRRCRRSDAARAVFINGVQPALGLIARTSAANNNSLEITGSFSITADDLNNGAPVGTVINKVGRTTGWTAGALTNKCVNTGVSGTNIVQLCQNFVSAGVAGGDSGSDAFRLTGSSSATLEGVLWGGAGNSFVYSPLQNVVAELGALRTH
jgi:hypothetical protein